MKKIKISLCMLLAVVLLGGCGGQIPDMTEEQRTAISEYAVELLLKYDTSQSGRLVDLALLEEEVADGPEVTPTPEPTEEPQVTMEPETTMSPTETAEPEDIGMGQVTDTPTVSVGGELSEQEYDALESTLLLPEDVTLQYLDYQVTDTYADPQDAELVLEAETGNKFMVVRFVLLNNGSSVQSVDLLHDNIMYDFIVDETAVDGMVTLLSNDMITYMDNLEPDESKEVVLLAEADANFLQNAESIYVEMSCGDFVSRIDIK